MYSMLQIWVSFEDEHRVYELSEEDVETVKDLMEAYGETNLNHIKDFLQDKKLIAFSRSGVPDLDDYSIPFGATRH